MSENHIAAETLAALAEGRPDVLDDEGWRHLETCPECQFCLADVVQLRLERQATPERFVSPPDLVARLKTAGPDPGGDPGRRSARRQVLRWIVPALAAVLAVAVFLAGTSWRRDDAHRPYIDEVAAAVALQQGRGMLLPGVPLATQHDTYRSAGRGRTAELSGAVNALGEAYSDRRGDPDLAFWLVSGCLAQGDLAGAESYVQDALGFHPLDDDLTVLAAVVAYRGSRLARADSLLRATLARDDGQERAWYNLGLLLLETGQPEEGRRYLVRLRDGATDPQLARLAGGRLQP